MPFHKLFTKKKTMLGIDDYKKIVSKCENNKTVKKYTEYSNSHPLWVFGWEKSLILIYGIHLHKSFDIYTANYIWFHIFLMCPVVHFIVFTLGSHVFNEWMNDWMNDLLS